MKVLETVKPVEIKLVERAMPKIGKEDILLKPKYVGFCGSGRNSFLGTNPLVQYPRIPGHEISVVIKDIGEKVSSSFKIGQYATVIPFTNCGQCASCKKKRFNACFHNQTPGVQRDGAMAEYITVQWQEFLADTDLNEIQLALVEPTTVGFHAVDNGKVNDLDTVLVFGCGMVGSGAIVRAKLRGATVIAVDIDNSKLEIARKFGAEYTINSKNQDLHEELQKITNGDGPTVVIEAAGNPVTYRTAIEEVAFAGRVVCIGYAGSEVSFLTKLWVQKELEIMGSRNANPSDFEAVIKYLKSNRVDENILISKIVSPEEARSDERMVRGSWENYENTGSVLKTIGS